jgi:acyl-CoA dehydrogenase
VPHSAPVTSLGHPPSPRCEEALTRVRAFLEALELPAQPDPFSLDLELKRRIQEASAASGLYCTHLAPADGGLGLPLVDMFWLQHEVYRRGIGGGQWMLAWTDGPSPLVSAWSPAAREAHLGPFLAGTTTVAFALTEPGAGSDFPSLATSARRDSAHTGYVLTGEKHLITGAPTAELAQVFARMEGAPRGELTAFLVPLDTPGVERGPVQQTIMGDGLTGSLSFREVRVPAEARLGEEGAALPLAFRWINWARTRRGGMCTGLARHCLERSVGYAHERETFGRPIAEHGAVGELLANMAMDVEALQALSLELLARLDRSALFTSGTVTAADRRDLSILKTWCDEALYRVSDNAIQVHGGKGLLTETGLERIFRVARNLRIPAGTPEIQRDLIARSL